MEKKNTFHEKHVISQKKNPKLAKIWKKWAIVFLFFRKFNF